MVAVKLQEFGGMIPALDARLLPQNASADATNSWVYSGAIEGTRKPQTIYTPSGSKITKSFRIPKQYYDKEHISDSYWLDFQDSYTTVIHSPTVNDSFERYYWASPSDIPYYNTKARIANANSPFKLGVPAPTVAPMVTRLSGAYTLYATTILNNINEYDPKLYKSSAYALDPDTVYNGSLPKPSALLKFRTNGQRVELRYGTDLSHANLRVTIADDGTVTQGVPTQTVAPNPATPPTGKGVLEARAYLYTWVTAYGEEGPPSPATVQTAYSGDPWVVKVSAPDTSVLSGRNITNVRIYRTVTAQSGATTYFFVAEIPIAQTVYTDSLPDDTVASNNILESTLWTAPPSDLQGMITMPNGIVAGWRENEVWFCEPYRPHAWPISYTIAVEYPIVGLGVIGQTLIVCTTSFPYAVSGINPASMSVSRIATYEPCLSRGSIVSTQEGVYYVSPNGLALAAAGQVQIITRDIVTKDHWLDLIYASSIRAARINGGYYAWGAIAVGCFEKTAFDNASYLLDDYTASFSGIFIDPRNGRVSLIKLLTDEPTLNMWTDTWTGEVFLMRSVLTGPNTRTNTVKWLNLASSIPHEKYIWKSKIFDMPNKRNLEALRIWWGQPDGGPATDLPFQPWNMNMQFQTGMAGIIRVYADGNLVFARQMVTSGEFMRLPSGFRATYWQIEIEGVVPVYSVEFATAAKELISV